MSCRCGGPIRNVPAWLSDLALWLCGHCGQPPVLPNAVEQNTFKSKAKAETTQSAAKKRGA